MSSCPSGVASGISNPSQPYFDLDQMLVEAKKFATKGTSLCAKTDKRVYEYIVGILRDGEFQKDPPAYLEKMRVARGTTEVLRIPEDKAVSFFYRREFMPK